MVCHICGSPASLICELCKLYVCSKHYDVLKTNKYLTSPFNSHKGDNLCHKCLAALNCPVCGKRSFDYCLNCKRYFCENHMNKIEYWYKDSNANDGRDRNSSVWVTSRHNNYCSDCKAIGEEHALKSKAECDNWERQEKQYKEAEYRRKNLLCIDCGTKLSFIDTLRERALCRRCYKKAWGQRGRS